MHLHELAIIRGNEGTREVCCGCVCASTKTRDYLSPGGDACMHPTLDERMAIIRPHVRRACMSEFLSFVHLWFCFRFLNSAEIASLHAGVAMYAL